MRPSGLDAGRRARLTAALGFVLLARAPRSRALTALHGWLDSWRGLGDVVGGTMREGFEFDLTGGPDGWSATFLAHRPHGGAPDIVGVAHEATPWRAVQWAAWMALARGT